jgi:putative copper resistance protein D
MRPDTLSVILRSASFIALFQAAGMAIFIAMFGRDLEVSRLPLRRLARFSAFGATVFLIGQYALEAARMADDISGIADPSLQLLAMRSASSVVLALRLVGLAFITVNVGRRDVGTTFSVLGAGLIEVSFLFTGHTAADPMRWALAPLLAIHVLIVAFWFGAIAPLYLVSKRETPVIAGGVTEAFSAVALWLVPGILLAGGGLALLLVHQVTEFRTGYGLSLLAKFSGFVLLMGFAAVNKWRLGPAIAIGDARTLKAFRRALGAEYLVIAAVLSITAIMTTFYSPEP